MKLASDESSLKAAPQLSKASTLTPALSLEGRGGRNCPPSLPGASGFRDVPGFRRLRMARRLRGLLTRLANLVRLLPAWWQADRVRASPREGRLLRIMPPCIVRISGTARRAHAGSTAGSPGVSASRRVDAAGRDDAPRYVEVLRRRTGQTPRGPYVCYECETETGSAELWVEPVGEGCCPRVQWREGGERFKIDAQDVEVFG